jgi:hypothetical protein
LRGNRRGGIGELFAVELPLSGFGW